MGLLFRRGNKRKSLGLKGKKYVFCDGDCKYIMGVGRDGTLTYYGSYDETNDEHKLLEKINIRAESGINNSVWEWEQSGSVF